ncbi:uncharacterized protein PITG_05034 [Phytophthora infestans T30-4]|uniref:Uncharacterized protein n=1 Tax=Phytophthora infestans (strain T30-4) TaxID=403677 RepID=D0N2M1_PHYIT|nr:uncharacterized protein PITG_05034 [Phytophthora infestans T30-4]EEY68550.1 conserved hypothetical protein [Phytophthora infestans T30-4]|eukprot:XP_002905709.1 conserved hypothetical protein [Phytophthora infestans T30-4]
MELVKPITSDHDLIELAKRIGVHLDAIFESNEITKPLPKKGSYLVPLRSPNLDVGHWQAGIGRYNPKQYQGTYGDYCAIMYRELTISSDVPASKLTKALKTGKLSLTADQLKGSGSVIHLHPASYEKALKARKAAFKFVKDSDLLSKGLDAAVPAIATAFGAPQAGIPARAAIKSLTGVGVYDSDSDTPEKEGGRISVADVKKAAKNALGHAKRKGILTDAIDAGEKFLLSKATKPEHENLIKSVRGEVKRRYGVGVPKKPAKGSPEMKAQMAALRAKRKKAMIAGSFRLN